MNERLSYHYYTLSEAMSKVEKTLEWKFETGVEIGYAAISLCDRKLNSLVLSFLIYKKKRLK